MNVRSTRYLAVCVGLLAFPKVGTAASLTERCEFRKITTAADYARCRSIVDTRAIRTRQLGDYTKCQSRFAAKWLATESTFGSACPQVGDASITQSFVDQFADQLVRIASGPSAPVCGTCGNASFEPGEECELGTLNGQSCTALGFLAGGDLGCRPVTCTFDTTKCCNACAVVRTGQTDSYSAERNDGVLGNPLAVLDDGAVQAGMPLAYADNGDGTASDLNTGLMWERKSSDGGLHDVHNRYQWSGDGTQDTIWDWLEDVNAEGGTGFAGHSDWRIPNVRELQSLPDYGRVLPSIAAPLYTVCSPGCTAESCGCIDTGGVLYWSSTSDIAGPTSAAWSVEFSFGSTQSQPKPSAFPVRAVRGGGASTCSSCVSATGQTASYPADLNDGVSGSVPVPDDGALRLGASIQYVDNGDGTVTDLNTGLMWEKKANDGGLHHRHKYYMWSSRPILPEDETIWDWLDDINAEGGMGFAGHNDWRIPNLREIASLIHYGTRRPSIYSVFNGDCPSGCSVLACSCMPDIGFDGVLRYYLSSTSYRDLPTTAWVAKFEDGDVGGYGKSFNFYVRAVRSATP